MSKVKSENTRDHSPENRTYTSTELCKMLPQLRVVLKTAPESEAKAKLRALIKHIESLN